MDSLPLIGASPDAIVRGKDGKLRALEVKSHAPFAPGGDGYPNFHALRHIMTLLA